MKLIEHIDHILGLIERSASYAELKGAVLAMHQEAEGRDRDLADYAEFKAQKIQMNPPPIRIIDQNLPPPQNLI